MATHNASGPIGGDVRRIRGLLAMVLLVPSGACSTPSQGEGSFERDTAGLRESERSVRVAPPDGTRQGTAERASLPAAVIGGETYTISQISPYLAEAAGALVLEELMVTRAAEAELARSGRALTQFDLDNERTELARALDVNRTGADPEQLVDSVRRARGLGPERFSLLVRRTAALRKLVSPDVTVSDAEIALAHQVRYGPRQRVRMLMSATEREAAGFLGELQTLDAATRRARFIELAMERSIDASGAAGGLLEPISAADPAYPLAVRTTISSLQPGQLSPVIALSPNYAIVLVEETIPDQGVQVDTVRETLRDDLRRRQERLLMDRKAQAIIEGSGITVVDPALQWSWRTRERR